jgi:hypothetical protein
MDGDEATISESETLHKIRYGCEANLVLFGQGKEVWRT